jgi:DNA-binding CsgD family transcriptional regulator
MTKQTPGTIAAQQLDDLITMPPLPNELIGAGRDATEYTNKVPLSSSLSPYLGDIERLFAATSKPTPERILALLQEKYPELYVKPVSFAKWFRSQDFYQQARFKKPNAREIIRQREAEIKQWIQQAVPVKKIAEKLNLASSTVDDAIHQMGIIKRPEDRTKRAISAQGRILAVHYRGFIKECLEKCCYNPTITALINEKAASKGLKFTVKNVAHYINGDPELRKLAEKRPIFMVFRKNERLAAVPFEEFLKKVKLGLNVNQLCQVFGFTTYSLKQYIRSHGYSFNKKSILSARAS